MGDRAMRFGETGDLLALRDRLRGLLGDIERMGGRKHAFGMPLSVAARKQLSGRPVMVAGKHDLGMAVAGLARKHGLGRPFATALAGKHGLGSPMVPVAGGKHLAGFAVDMIDALRRVSERLDIVAERVGFKPRSLGVAATLRSVLSDARAQDMSRKDLEAMIAQELDFVYSDPQRDGVDRSSADREPGKA